MGLLQDIIEDARRSDASVSQVLRSLRILASRGRVDDLTEWVRREVSGYGPDDALPSYRGPFPGHAMGHFSGPFGSEATISIPDFGFPEDFKKQLFNIDLRGPMAELENMLAVDQAESQLRWHWPANAVVLANRLMADGKVAQLPGHGLVSAWLPITSNVLTTAVDGVRNRVLELALELELVSPELGTIPSATSEHREEISAKFNQVIFAQHVQVGETFSPNYGVSITAGDPASLDRYLAALGVADADQRKEVVEAAIEARAQGEKEVRSGSKLKEAAKKVAALAQKAGAKATDVLIEAMIQRWLGE